MSWRDTVGSAAPRRLRRMVSPAWLALLRRRTRPISEAWGYDRGTPIDRYYIEQFLQEHRADIRGRVLEVKSSDYTDRFGLEVKERDVLDIDSSNPRATIVADLAAPDAFPADCYDCFVLTQTLQFIYDTRSALRSAYRLLRPGGVLLATVPALSRLDRRMPDYWRLTPDACGKLFGEIFGPENVSVQAYGNVLAANAFLLGMAFEEVSRADLDKHDRFYPVLVAVRAVKQDGSERP